MIAAEIIGQVLAAGGQIVGDGADLVLTAPRPLPDDMLDRLKAHKPASPPGDIPMAIVQTFAQAAIAREAEDLREHFEERAGILEVDGLWIGAVSYRRVFRQCPRPGIACGRASRARRNPVIQGGGPAPILQAAQAFLHLGWHHRRRVVDTPQVQAYLLFRGKGAFENPIPR